MVMVEKEQHLNMRMEHIRFGKEELERRRKISRLYSRRSCRGATQGPLSRLHRRSAPWIQSTNVSFLDQLSRSGEEMEYSGKQLGHRHTVEAVIYIHQGRGTASSTVSSILGRPVISSACPCSRGIGTTMRARRI